MRRAVPPSCLALLLALANAPAWGEDKPSLKEVLGQQEVLQNAIAEAEPAIGCIFVSRSEGYRRLLRDTPPPDNPGKLGSFDFDKARTSLNLAAGEPRLDELKRLDLGDSAHVPESYGSGVVIDERGLVLTHYHVVRDAAKLYVRLPGDRGSYADIHAADPRSDLAVLRLLDVPTPCKAIKLGEADKVRKGQLLLTIANPFTPGFRGASPTASWGILSNVRLRARTTSREDERTRTLTLHHHGTLWQTDARLNLNCSGGAVIDLKGELIGLTTALPVGGGTETNGGLAVPLDAGMRRIVEVLRRGEEVEYGFLGVVLSAAGQLDRGVKIEDVGLGSPADWAGLRREDIILSINGTATNSNDDLFLAVGMALAGSQVRLEVRSPLGGPVRTVTTTLGKFYVPEKLGKSIASNRPPAVRGLRVDHATLLTQIVQSRRSIPRGVLVREVQANSAAETAHVKVNDVILEVNGRTVTSPAEFYRETQKTTGPLELKLLDHPRPVKIN